MESQNANQFECCPPFEPGPWEDTMITWRDKQFVKDKVFTLFHMPMNFGQVMRRLDKKVKGAGATLQDNLCLSDHTSNWNMDLYLAVDKEVPGADNTCLSGKFYSKVYEGPFKDTGKWCKDFEKEATSKGLSIKKWFMWYTTCPKCAKKYGKNYVAVLGEVD
jgi:hypothetical protein